jgi:hypothetical protein
MAIAKRNTIAGPATAFYKRLKTIGCTFCRPCFAYMPAIHDHTRSLALDLSESRYVLVGSYGNVKAVERDADALVA